MNLTLNFLKDEGIYSNKLLDCIQKCLNEDYKQRYTLEQIETILFTAPQIIGTLFLFYSPNLY